MLEVGSEQKTTRGEKGMFGRGMCYSVSACSAWDVLLCFHDFKLRESSVLRGAVLNSGMRVASSQKWIVNVSKVMVCVGDRCKHEVVSEVCGNAG